MNKYKQDESDIPKNSIEKCRAIIRDPAISTDSKIALVTLESDLFHGANTISFALRSKEIILNRAERKRLATEMMSRIPMLVSWGFDCGKDYAQALVEIGDKSFAPQLELAGYPVHAKWLEGNITDLITIGESGEPEQRIVAIEALGELGAIEAVEPLTTMLESNNISINTKATEALGKIGSVKAVGPLIVNLIEGRSAIADITCGVLDKLLGEDWRQKV